MDFKNISSEKFTPMQNFILIKPSSTMEGKKEEEKTESGLILSLAKDKSVVNDRPTNGIVLSCGPECKVVKQGMEIFWDIIRGQDIEFKNGFHMMLTEDSVLGFRHADENL
jgi:co-chaperonin GroES (HSP10)